MKLRRTSKKRPKQRLSKGFTLVEALVALLIGAIFSAAFLDIFSTLLRTNTTTQNEICANTIAQTMIENAQALGYNFLVAKTGTWELYDQGAPFTTAIKQDPVLLDLVGKNWSDKVKTSNFRGKVTCTIEPVSTIPSALIFSVIVKWSDGAHAGTQANPYGRSITTSTILTDSGFNKWEQ